MSDLRDLMERGVAPFEPQRFTGEDLRRRVAGRQKRTRILTAVGALVLTVVATSLLVTSFGGDEHRRHTPVQSPTPRALVIDPDTLRRAWSAVLPEGHLEAGVAHDDGRVYLVDGE